MQNSKPEPQTLDELAAEAEAMEAAGETPPDVAPDGDAEEQPSDELEALRAERDEYKDRFVRALADAENTRKRADRDRREAENYGGSRLARDLLPVYDNLDRALQAIPEDQAEGNAALVEGIQLTKSELVSVFRKHGIEPVAPEIGDKFDPQAHQAMFEAPVPDTKAGEIIQVMTVGFYLHDRLLRPAQVGVSSTPAS